MKINRRKFRVLSVAAITLVAIGFGVRAQIVDDRDLDQGPFALSGSLNGKACQTGCMLVDRSHVGFGALGGGTM